MIPVYKCKKCRWIGKDTIFVDGDTECCPRCHDVNFMELVSLEITGLRTILSDFLSEQSARKFGDGLIRFIQEA